MAVYRRNGSLTLRRVRRRWRRGQGWPVVATAASTVYGGARGGGAPARFRRRGRVHRVEHDVAMPAVWLIAEVLHYLRR